MFLSPTTAEKKKGKNGTADYVFYLLFSSSIENLKGNILNDEKKIILFYIYVFDFNYVLKRQNITKILLSKV